MCLKAWFLFLSFCIFICSVLQVSAGFPADQPHRQVISLMSPSRLFKSVLISNGVFCWSEILQTLSPTQHMIVHWSHLIRTQDQIDFCWWHLTIVAYIFSLLPEELDSKNILMSCAEGIKIVEGTKNSTTLPLEVEKVVSLQQLKQAAFQLWVQFSWCRGCYICTWMPTWRRYSEKTELI